MELPPTPALKEYQATAERIRLLAQKDQAAAIMGALVQAWNEGFQHRPPPGALSNPPGWPPASLGTGSLDYRLSLVENKISKFERTMRGYEGK
jgi:hypothetical protein